MDKTKSLFLLDGNSLTHRAFYALPPMSTADGQPTNAAFGFTRMLLKLLKDGKPDYLAVAFDLKAPTFRHKEYDAYKGTRDKTPDDLVPQFAIVREILQAFDIPIFMLEGFEADDLLGTLAKAGEKAGHTVTIVTGDRDAFQLVSDKIGVMYNKKGITDIEDFNMQKIHEKYGLEPEQLIDVKSLMGDASDNIPGVPGIGEKTAIALIQEYGSLEGVYENIEKITGKRKETLLANRDIAFLSKRLATIVTDAPILIDFSQCQVEEPDNERVAGLFKRLEFKSLVEQFAVHTRKTVELPTVEYTTLTDDGEMAKVLPKLRGKKVWLDILLSGEDPMRSEITGVMLVGDRATHRESSLYYIPLTSLGSNTSLFDTARTLPSALHELLSDGETPKTIYQAKVRMVALRRYGVQLKGLTFDPDIAVYLLNPSEKNPTLPEIFTEYLDLTLPAIEDRVYYSAVKVSMLAEIEERLTARLRDDNMLGIFSTIEIPLEEVLAEMEFNGIDLDEDYLHTLSGELAIRLEEISKQIYEIADYEFNINSPKQLGEVLFEKLAMPVIKKTKTGPSTGVEVLEELEKYDQWGIIKLIYEYRELSKLKSTYVDALPPLVHPETGRIHTYFNQTVTATGRLSSTEPNLQNIPIRTEEGRKIRAAFIASQPDTILLTADYSQVELRILAHISKDPGLIEAFQSNADIHSRTAAEVFDLPLEEVDKEHRRRAKAINFGIAYGLSPFGLSRDLGIAQKEAERYIEKYFTRYRGVKEYIDSTIELAKKQGYVTTMENRRRYLPDINGRNFHLRSFAERMAINTPIQGSAADIMKIAMLKVHTAMQAGGYRSKLLLQVHDELVLEVQKDELLEIAGLIQREMEGAYQLSVPLLVDVETGDNWRDQATYSGGA